MLSLCRKNICYRQPVDSTDTLEAVVALVIPKATQTMMNGKKRRER